MRTIIARYSIDLRLLEDILLGVESDLTPARFPTFRELSEYCYRVASAVGLVSIEIFGYGSPVCRDYARYLGTAPQLTNIVRDVETDLKNGERIYLPLDELAQFGYSENDLIRRVYDQRFLALIQHQAARARDFFHNADMTLPREDRHSMLPARMMHQIYFGLLKQIERDRFRMFWKRYRLSKLEKIMMILPSAMRRWWPWRLAGIVVQADCPAERNNAGRQLA
jgi:phytoene synthase